MKEEPYEHERSWIPKRLILGLVETGIFLLAWLGLAVESCSLGFS